MKRRTELHIHSNMSVMDGLTDIKMLLEKADRENMYAVAITDHGVCHGFPELFRLILRRRPHACCRPPTGP